MSLIFNDSDRGIHNGILARGAQILNQGHPSEALKLFRHVLATNPDDAAACFNAGVACHTLKDYAQAERYYKKAIERHPVFVQAYHNLAQVYTACNQLAHAIEAYEQALRLDPGDYKSAYNLSLLFYQKSEQDRSMRAIQTAIRANPDFAEAFNHLGMIHMDLGRYDEALVCFEQAALIKPELTVVYYNRGILFQKTGDHERGLEQYRKAMTCNPAFAPARWLYLLSLPMIYDFPQQIGHYRRRFQTNLDQLVASTPLGTQDQKTYALKGIQTTTNFYLQYQCGDDLALQKKYGCFVSQIMSANFPRLACKKTMPALAAGDKIRIGYVSTFMCDHTIGVFLSGWLAGHTRRAFEIHCYHVGKKVDKVTGHLRDLSHHFHHFPNDMASAVQRINADDLHILVFTDIGMDPITMQLAALRLAPVQCKGWGHPVTTGLPTIDYYLSSDLMEPEDADRHYSESLVRLPNIALYYQPPKLPACPKPRAQFGIPNDRFVYLSSQSIFKYLPQDDDIYPRIAKAAPKACFVFIGNKSRNATERFTARLESAFAHFGLKARDYCCFVNKMNFDDFLSLNLAADVLLDSIGWSGGKTTLEALACGLPVITLPGRFMRGRHAYAMLKMIGVSDTIVNDKTGYCEMAVRLAENPDYLSRLKQRIAENRHKLYQDQTFMTALETFYRDAIKRHART